MGEVILTVYNDSGSPPVGHVMDLDGTETIALSLLITDILQLDVRGTFSKEFRVPWTPANAQFFGPINNVGYDGWFDFNRKTRASIATETLLISRGHIQIKKMFRVPSGEFYAELVFFGDTPDLARTIGEKKLSEIEDLPNLDHTSTYADIAASVAGTFESGDAMYALTDKGFNFSEEGTPGTRQVMNPATPLYGNELTLCINEGYLFRQIMADAGFELNAVTLLAELDTMWMPFISDTQYTKCAEDVNTEGFGVHLSSDLTGLTASTQVTSLTEDYDLGTNFASNQFTVPFTGWFAFFGQVRIEKTSGAGNSTYQIQLRLSDNTTPILIGNAASIDSGDGEISLSFFGQNQQIFLNSGDIVELWVHEAGSGNFTIHSGALNSATGTWWKLVSVSPPAWGGSVIVANNAPDMKQMDFVRDKIKQFNLAVVPDKDFPNKITFEPLVDYIGSGATLDWTSKIDISKDVIIAPTTDTQSRTLRWTYGKEDDALNKIYFNFARRIFGENYISDLENDFATSEMKIELVTKPTPCNLIPGTNIIIPKFLDDNGKFFKPGPRSLYYSGTALGVMVYDDGGAAVESTEVPVLNHMNTTDGGIGASDYDLNFGVETLMQPVNGVPYLNLYYRWWKDYINSLYSAEARIMEANFALNLTDILTLSFADKIYIIDSFWRLLEIQDYNVEGVQVVRCKLLRILANIVDCAWSPYSVAASGQVTFVAPDGVTTGDGTETCCERYGYEWNAAASKCFAFTDDKPDHPVTVALGAVGPGQPIQVPGAISTPIIEISSDFTVTPQISTYLVDSSGAAVTITLPSALKFKPGIEFTIKKIDSSGNNVVIDGNGSETIDRAATVTLNTQDHYRTIKSDGQNWYIIAQN